MIERWHLRLNTITVGVCASYLTLGIAQPEAAAGLWAVYAGVTFVLAVLSLYLDKHSR